MDNMRRDQGELQLANLINSAPMLFTRNLQII
jgi:hypothetical protein